MADLAPDAGAGADDRLHRRFHPGAAGAALRKEDAELSDFPPPAGATPLAQTVLRRGARRLVERSLATDESVFTVTRTPAPIGSMRST